MAWIHLGLGDTDSFFDWMARAIDERDHMVMPIKTSLLRKMNLAQPSVPRILIRAFAVRFPARIA